jgi:hypothetical protein
LISQKPVLDSNKKEEGSNNDTSFESSSNNNNNFKLSAIEAQVAQHNLILYKQMKRKGRQSAKTFEIGQIAILFILLKLQLQTENIYIIVYIISTNCRYILLTKYSLLSRYFQGRELNTVDKSVAQLLGEEILFKL